MQNNQLLTVDMVQYGATSLDKMYVGALKCCVSSLEQTMWDPHTLLEHEPLSEQKTWQACYFDDVWWQDQRIPTQGVNVMDNRVCALAQHFILLQLIIR